VSIVLVVVALMLALVDWRQPGNWSVGLGRQTERSWRLELGPDLAAVLWGLDLGLGITTIRVTALFWLAALLAMAAGSPIVGALTMLAYGLCQAAGVLVGRWLRDRGVAPVSLINRVPQLRHASATVLAGWTASLIAALALSPLMR
jgi:hypothetical protein